MKAFLASLFFPILLTAQDQVPFYRVARTLDTVRVDGRLSEFTWAALPRVGRFTNIRRPDEKVPAATEAAMAWDDQNLYVAFACHDAEPWGTMFERDSRLWEQEVVEVFLDPDGDGKNYPELEVTPHNVVVDLLIPAPRSGADTAAKWNIKGLRTAVGKHAGGWTVEMAIPWSSLGQGGITRTPKSGDRWRVGLYRIERPGGPEVAGKVVQLQKRLEAANEAEKKTIESEIEALTAGRQFLAWSPTRVERGFHDPERFGIVEFVLKP